MTFPANDDHVATRHGFTAAFGLAFAHSRSGSPPSLGQDNWRTIQSHDAEWKPTVTTRPDATTVGSVSESFAYSRVAELATCEAHFAGTPPLTVQYTGDGLGRVTRKVETVQGVTTPPCPAIDPITCLVDTRSLPGSKQ